MPDKENIVRICIDDFALKRRYRYGTVMINIDTGRIIDMIESREKDEVVKWLSTFPNIQVVSRDGSKQYAAAIKLAHPKATQVSDRFHLIANLTDYAKKHISKVVTANIRIPLDEGETAVEGGYWEKGGSDALDLPERVHVSLTEKKREIIGRVRTLAAQGLTRTEIAAETGISLPTIKKYVETDVNPSFSQFGTKRDSKLKRYTAKIDAMLVEQYTFREIEDAIRSDGYDGAASTIRMYATRQRRLINDAKSEGLRNTELIERKWVSKLLYQPIEKVKGITENQVVRVVREYPVVGVLYDVVRSFKEIMFSKRVDELDYWAEAAGQLGIEEIGSFVNAINADLEAVKNSIRYEYNNGLAEGSVNKLKLTKRIMYGRCSFKLLRAKALRKEFNKNIN